MGKFVLRISKWFKMEEFFFLYPALINTESFFTQLDEIHVEIAEKLVKMLRMTTDKLFTICIPLETMKKDINF
jgi:hypothetical protein